MLHDIVELVSAMDSVSESPAIQLSDIIPSGGVPPPSILTKFMTATDWSYHWV